MSDLVTFLGKTVPDLLRELHNTYPFVVVGTRAVNAYLADVSMPVISTVDWDVAYIGDVKGQKSFVQEVEMVLGNRGYRIEVDYHAPSMGLEGNTFSFRSRAWVRLSVSMGKDNLTFLDVYRIPYLKEGTGLFLRKNGLLYSDLGFLLRELNRAEYDANKIMREGSGLTMEQITNKLKSVDRLLEDSGMKLYMISNQAIELDKYSNRDVKSIARDVYDKQVQRLEQAKHTLTRVLKEREALFGAVRSGKLEKPLAEQICGVCAVFEDQYGQYNRLKEQCQGVLDLCRG